MSGDIHVAILVPCHATFNSKFGFSLASMLFYIAQQPPKGLASIQFEYEQTSNLVQSRQSLADRALERGATHLLWIDSDMAFPRDLVTRMIESMDRHEVDFLAANCAHRVPPHWPTAIGLDGRHLYTEESSTGVEIVKSIGLAVAMIRSTVFEKTERPWFRFEWLPKNDRFAGEDIYFCYAAHQAGHPPYIDHELSKKIQHLEGQIGFDVEDSVMWKKTHDEMRDAEKKRSPGA